MKRFHLYNAKRFAKVSPENKDLLDDYLLELEFTGKSKNTINAYKADIRQLFCWLFLFAKNKYVLKCRKRDFRRFFLDMKRHDESNNRVNRVGSSIRNMLEYAADDDDVYSFYKQNVMSKIKTLEKKPRRHIYFLTDTEVTKMIDYLVKHHKLQLATFVSVAYDSGARRQELAQIHKKPFLVDGNKQTNIVTGKEEKRFRLLFWERSRDLARRYLKKRGHDDIKSLWITSDGKRAVSYQELYHWVRYLRRVLFRVSGRKCPINAHTFRHSALNNYYDQSHWVYKKHPELKGKVNINLIKTIAHHQNVQTTLGYIKNTDKQQLKNVFKL